MNVLIACEESQSECIAFRSYGDNAFSCDLRHCSGGLPEYHIVGDALPLLDTPVDFYTQDKKFHHVDKWDLVIAHPPCTYLSSVASPLLFKDFCGYTYVNYERLLKGLAARDFFMDFYKCRSVSRICIENPRPIHLFGLPHASQIIEPFYFGHKYTKRTYLWLLNLPPLFSTDIVVPEDSFVKLHGDGYHRSKSHDGISFAMASQWRF